MMTVADGPVLVERRDHLAIVTLNRPGRRNGVNLEMCVALLAALQDIARGDARVVMLRGAGDDFSVGADLAGVGDDQKAPEMEDPGSIYHSATLLHGMPQVTMAVIDGGCAGAAMGWACACDLRFASERARFATAFLKVGVSGDMGLIWSLSRLVGAARARELLFFSEKITAATALAYDLVTRVYPAETLHEAALAAAVELSNRDGLALRMMKANVVSAETLALADYIDIETSRHQHVIKSGAFREHARAFLKQPKEGAR